MAETLQRSLLPRLPADPGPPSRRPLPAREPPRPGSAATGTTRFRCEAARSGSRSATWSGAGSRPPPGWPICRARSGPTPSRRSGRSWCSERMNGFVLEGEQGGMVTLLYAIVDPDASTLHVATAGHPPPLVLRPGGRADLRRGTGGQPARSEPLPVLRREHGDARPLVDRAPVHGRAGRGAGAPAGRGARRASLATAESCPREPEGLCRALLSTVDSGPASATTSRCWPSSSRPPGETLSLALPAKPSSLASMRRAVAQWLRLAGASEAEVYEMLVACGEACANAVAHAHSAISDSPFEVEAERDGPQIQIVVRDCGQLAPAERRRPRSRPAARCAS